MPNKYIAFDCETGGIGSDKSLLTAYFEVLDEDLNVTTSLSLKVKPDDETYHVTAEALGINKINLVKHNAEALYEKSAGTALYNFLAEQSNHGKIKLIPIGQNVKFDADFLWDHLITRKTWEKFVSYRVLDTATIGLFLRELNIIPMSVSGSLGSYCKHYGVFLDAHDAMGDTKGTVAVLKAMIKDLKRG
jgi:DNA polymerase III alpha subunit (gram-positive type)